MTRTDAFRVIDISAQSTGEQKHVVAAPDRDQAVLSGAARDLWIGSGLLLLAFLAVVAFMMVWRVGGAKARSRKRNAAVFQPAGDGAEITFDDEAAAAPTAKEARERRKREKAERAAVARAAKSSKAPKPVPPQAELTIDDSNAADEAEVVIERARATDEVRAAEPKKPDRRSQPFGALFARRKKPDLFVPGTLDLGSDNPAADQTRLHPLANERRRPRDEERVEAPEEALPPEPRRPVRQEAEEAHRLAERLEEERRQERSRLEAAEEMRRKAIDEARIVADRQQNEAEISRRAETARLQAEAEAREEARRRNYEREAEFERRKQLAAIEQRERELRRAESSNDSLRRDLSQELERKIEALAARLPDRPLQTAQFVEPPAADPALLRAVDRIARDLAQHRTALDEAVSALSTRIEEVGAATRDGEGLRQELAGLKRALGERFAGPSAPMMQLEDILRNALPPDAYDLRVMLSNNRKADCIVRLPNPPGSVAIDSRFPIEAFQKLHTDEGRDQSAAENEFRRDALRHIVDIAERLIIPGETADSAMLFLPSESMHTELLARFQDLVQDSYRARVWIVSPTTLMAALHTMRAVLRDAPKAQAQAAETEDPHQVLSEVEALRRRVMSLESSFDKVHHDLRDLIAASGRPAAPAQHAFDAPPVSAPQPSPSPAAFLTAAANAPAHTNGAAHTASPVPSSSAPTPPPQPRAETQPDRPPPAFLLPPVPPVR